MRTDRNLLRVYQAGWGVAALVAFRVWRMRLRDAQQRAIEAERSRDEAARRQAVEERLRIARELHDSLTHSISVIRVQAGVAVHLARKRDEEVPAALQAIEEASSDASRELRATLSVLRDRDGRVGLEQLAGLVSRAAAAGLSVTVTVTGAECALPADVDWAAYRIVQEALTNVTRHSGQASACVEVSYEPAVLTVRVDDEGTGTKGQPLAPGLGITGMRERASALGGQLKAGPRPGGGFRVQAELPLQASA